jgi:hypothetical protein
MRRTKLIALGTLFLLFVSVPSFAITTQLIGWNDDTINGITSSRVDWAELAEVEDYATDDRITASGSFTPFDVGPNPWNEGIWILAAGGYVETAFDNPSDSLFVQFESDANDGPAEFILDGSSVYTVNTWNAGWFAVVFSDLDTTAHTLRVVSTGVGIPDDLAIDVMGSGAPFSGDPVPEPATMLLVGTGLAGLAGIRRKFKR